MDNGINKLNPQFTEHCYGPLTLYDGGEIIDRGALSIGGHVCEEYFTGNETKVLAELIRRANAKIEPMNKEDIQGITGWSSLNSVNMRIQKMRDKLSRFIIAQKTGSQKSLITALDLFLVDLYDVTQENDQGEEYKSRKGRYYLNTFLLDLIDKYKGEIPLEHLPNETEQMMSALEALGIYKKNNSGTSFQSLYISKKLGILEIGGVRLPKPLSRRGFILMDEFIRRAREGAPAAQRQDLENLIVPEAKTTLVNSLHKLRSQLSELRVSVRASKKGESYPLDCLVLTDEISEISKQFDKTGRAQNIRKTSGYYYLNVPLVDAISEYQLNIPASVFAEIRTKPVIRSFKNS